METAWLIPVLPVISFAAILLIGDRLKENCGYIAASFVFGSLLLSLGSIASVLNGKPIEIAGVYWANLSGFQFGILIDGVSAVLLFVVSFIGFLIVVYSIGYMHGDAGVQRYYAEMSLFIAAMLALVISNNLLFTFIAWEIVGLCSYFLIGFWYRKPSASIAAKKAFLVTRFGDFAFLAGILVIYSHFGTLDYREIFELAPKFASVDSGVLGMSVVTLAALLIFGGAIGKSAQFPLHVWLPDAMEGPTTVSALIHAATMVKAGVFLVARMYPLFLLSDQAMTVVAFIGAITALIAAAMGAVMTDVKRVVAYSTVSSLGFMTLALGVGGLYAALFYLIAHGFFKALLFLAAGAVIHATNTNDIRFLGGLWEKMPITAPTALIGAWAASGLPPLSGFWSKDEILLAVYAKSKLLFLIALLAAFLFAFFVFRWFFLIFMGRESKASKHAHEAPRVMTAPLIILAVGAASLGALKFFNFEHWVASVPLYRVPEISGPHTAISMLSIVIALIGTLLAGAIYYQKRIPSEVFVLPLKPLHALVANKYYIDHIYAAFAEKLGVAFCFLLNRFDIRIVDGTVNGIGIASLRAAEVLRKAQTGMVQDYASAVLLGAALLIIILRLTGGSA